MDTTLVSETSDLSTVCSRHLSARSFAQVAIAPHLCHPWQEKGQIGASALVFELCNTNDSRLCMISSPDYHLHKDLAPVADLTSTTLPRVA